MERMDRDEGANGRRNEETKGRGNERTKRRAQGLSERANKRIQWLINWQPVIIPSLPLLFTFISSQCTKRFWLRYRKGGDGKSPITGTYVPVERSRYTVIQTQQGTEIRQLALCQWMKLQSQAFLTLPLRSLMRFILFITLVKLAISSSPKWSL